MIINRFVMAICLSFCCASAAFADLMPDKNEKGKYGYLNEDGSVAIKYDYNEAYAFADGRALVRKGDKWGYINSQGKEVIKIRYTELDGTWANGICKVAVGGKVDDGILTGAKYGFIDQNGQELLKPEYNEIGEFIDGIAFVEKSGKYGYIDTNCKFVIPCEYDAVGSANEIGLIWVNKGGKYKMGIAPTPGVRYNMGGSFGIFNRQGKVIIPCEYKSVGMFMSDSLIRENNVLAMGNTPLSDESLPQKIVEKYMNHTKLMKNDYRYNMYVQIAAFEILYTRNPDLYPRSKLTLTPVIGNTRRSGGLSRTTEVSAANVSFTKFSKLPFTNFNDDSWAYVWASKNYEGSYPAIFNATSGEKVLEGGKYECVGVPSDHIMVVANKVGNSKMAMNYYSMIKKSTLMDDDFVFDAKADKEKFTNMLMSFDNNMGEIKRSGISSMINSAGIMVDLPSTYDRISDLQDNIAVVQYQGNFGLIEFNQHHTSASVLVAGDYGYMAEPTEGLVLAKKGNNFGFLNLNGTEALPFKYSMASSFKNGAARVAVSGKWGLIDKKGGELVPAQWRNVLDLDTVGNRYVWVAEPVDSLMFAYDIKSKKLLGGGYKSVFSYFGKDDMAYASKVAKFDMRNDDGEIVKTPMEAIGCVTPEGEVLIPFAFFNLDAAKKTYADMVKAGKRKLSTTDGIRLALYATDLRNKFKLIDIIPNEMWDY